MWQTFHLKFVLHNHWLKYCIKIKLQSYNLLEFENSLNNLSLQLLKAQKKAMKKKQEAKLEAERRRLATVLQVHHLLASLQEEHVKRDLLAGHNQAPCVPAQQLHSLSQLTTLLGVKRDNRQR